MTPNSTRSFQVSASFVFLLFLSFPFDGVSQKYPTNNVAKYDEASAKVFVDSLYNQAQKEPESFGRLAFKYSQDPGSFRKYGIIKDLALKDMNATFAYYIQSQSIGEISKPFQTIFGWHLVRMLSKDENNYTFEHLLIRIRQ